MAERLNKRQADSTRSKIQASQLINRLQNHAYSLPELPEVFANWLDKWEEEINSLDPDCLKDLQGIFNKLSVDMSQSQVRAAQILLNKALPDLRSVELTGDPDKPVSILPIEFVEADGQSETTGED